MSKARVELANVDGRASLLCSGRVIDVAQRSSGRFSDDPMQVIEQWGTFVAWARGVDAGASDPALDPLRLGPCVPRPRQVFAIGLNYREHGREAGFDTQTHPMVFTKFPSCLAGPHASIELTSDYVDWEVELVVAIGTRASRVRAADAMQHVAGYCVGQDVSDREVQMRGKPAQFSLGKSASGFGPIGPALVASEDVELSELELTCDVNGERMQHGLVRDMAFPVPTLVEYLSQHLTLLPGDLIFTGTPSGVGLGRTPPRFLRAGDCVRSEIRGVGLLENTCVSVQSMNAR